MPVIDLQKQYLLDPGEWMSAAEELLAGAALFEPQLQEYWESRRADRMSLVKYPKSHLMLAGFAMENILKALIVQDQRAALEEEFDTKSRLPKILQSHNLITLSDRARLSISDDGTKEHLKHLTRHSVWAGRYPVPLRPSDLPAPDAFGLGEDFVPLDNFEISDWKKTQVLFKRAKDILEQRMSQPSGGR
jgi:hypothetical protein